VLNFHENIDTLVLRCFFEGGVF